MNITYGFDSELWWTDIARLSETFLDYINRQGNDGPIVKLNPKELAKAKEVYFKNLMAFKNKVYGKKAAINKIDRHKIIALYIKSFLEVSPFHIENRSNQVKSIIQSYPNEYFSMELMFLILMAWNNKKCEIEIDEKEKKWFIILLNHFKLEINTLDVLSLSQIIYYIEDKYIINAP